MSLGYSQMTMNSASPASASKRPLNTASATIYLVSKSVDRLTEGRRLAAQALAAGEAELSRATRGIHPDILELSPPEGKERIGIAAVREIIRAAQFAPVQSAHKVCLIANAEGLTVEAANALLKILEEPPRGLKFILLADHPSDLLPTIVSRSRLIRIPIATPAQIASRLDAAGYDRPAAEWLAQLALRNGELDQLLAEPRNVQAELTTAGQDLSGMDMTGLVDACVGDDPILRRQAFLCLLGKVAERDPELLCVGVRILGAQTRDTLARFLHECLLTVAELIRSFHIASELADPMTDLIREKLGIGRLHRLSMALDEANRSMAVYGPVEGILLSLLLTSEGANHDS